MKIQIKTLGIAAILALSSMSANAVPIYSNGHYYEFIREVKTWDDARAAALASTYNGLSGYLATITSAAENAFLYSLLTAADGAGGWIGGTDVGSEGTFYWADGPESGQLFSSGYTNWDAFEPNQFQGTEEDYVQMTTREQGGWNDLTNNGTFLLSGYFVEYSAVPEPGTLALLGLGLLGLGFSRRKTSV